MDYQALADEQAFRGSFAVADRVEVVGPPAVDVRAHLSEPQRRAFDSDARIRAILAGRRAGKTVWAGGFGIHHATNTPRSLVTYLGLTAKSARLIMWSELKAWAFRLGFPSEWISDHTMTLNLPPWNSSFVCAGTDDMRTIESWRGTKMAAVMPDECGAQQNGLLRYLVRDILRPTLVDQGGYMALLGTPGLTIDPDAYWCQVTHTLDGPIPVFTWTVLDNPYVPNAPSELEAIKLENGWTDETPSFRREWLAQWCEDPGALVYPFNLERNGCDELPANNSHGRPIDAGRWRYVVACDPAGVGTTGIAVVAGHPDLVGWWVCRSEAHHGLLVDGLVDRVRALRGEYPQAAVVVDAGGLGSVHSQEMTRKFAIGLEHAEKRDKPSAIRMTRDDLLSGRGHVLNGPQNDAWRSEAAVLGWDEKRLQHNPDQADHCCDSVIYGVRRLQAYTREERKPEPVLGTDDYYAKIEADEIARRIKPMNRRQPMWDR